MTPALFISFLIIFASQDLSVAFQGPTGPFRESPKPFAVEFHKSQLTHSRTKHTPLWVGGTLDDGFDGDKEPLIKRIKTHIKSYHDYKDEAERTVLRRMEPYVKYPFRRVRNYFRGEKQEEVDAFNDIIVSDEVVENAEAAIRLETETKYATETTADLPSIPVHATIVTPNVEEASKASAEYTTTVTAEPLSEVQSHGVRSAVSAPNVNLSGQWSIIATDEFKQQYDKYLTLLGQPFLVRSMALSIVGLTNEETEQRDNGKTLAIRGENARGVWERTLEASGLENPVKTPIVTVDAERVEAEAWWEQEGQIHVSWLRGVQKYGGGDFESKRYLEEDGNVLVCETTFHPNDVAREKAQVTWRFQRKN